MDIAQAAVTFTCRFVNVDDVAAVDYDANLNSVQAAIIGDKT